MMALKSPYLFEFMDQEWVPQSLRMTMREALECCLSRPFRNYYETVASEVVRIAISTNCSTIVELGAGTAPISIVIARTNALPKSVRLVATDLNPDEVYYRELEARYPKVIFPVYEPVDFSKPLNFPPDTLFVLSASFHHLPAVTRTNVLQTLVARPVVLCEPMQRSATSAFLAAASIIPALFAPLLLAYRSGRLRRIFWCWLLPIAGPLLAWDGIVSSARCWTIDEWHENLKTCTGGRQRIHTQARICYFAVSWS
jgi:hypothetical protein